MEARNKTILFCSHSLYDVRQLCDEAIWLDQGKDMAQGESVSVTARSVILCQGPVLA